MKSLLKYLTLAACLWCSTGAHADATDDRNLREYDEDEISARAVAAADHPDMLEAIQDLDAIELKVNYEQRHKGVNGITYTPRVAAGNVTKWTLGEYRRWSGRQRAVLGNRVNAELRRGHLPSILEVHSGCVWSVTDQWVHSFGYTDNMLFSLGSYSNLSDTIVGKMAPTFGIETTDRGYLRINLESSLNFVCRTDILQQAGIPVTNDSQRPLTLQRNNITGKVFGSY